MDEQTAILKRFARDRVLAHSVIFKHRHPNATPPFLADMIRAWHSPAPFVLFEVFRGGAKSTTAEEAILLKAAFREIHNYLIIGSTKDRAFERLHAIRYEVEQNEVLAELFGDLRGSTWGDGELVLSNNVRLLAMGKGQSLRGVKYLDARPDGVFADDLEEPEDVRTPEARERLRKWFLFDLMPALDVRAAHARVAATPLDPDALPAHLIRQGWVHKLYPIEYTDDLGMRRPTWPDRFPLAKVDELRNAAQRSGHLREYNMEYMCMAENPADKPFRPEMFRVEPQIRTWQAVYAMYDPARTVGAQSATTGFAAWSWIGNRLVVWDAWGRQLMPDEIISSMFEINETYSPTWLGAEEDGLNQWLLQPIRQEQAKRGVMLPLRPVKAPRGKIDFIRGSLQPFFNARELYFAKDLPDLKAQLLSFPTGKIDVPNALAYAILLRAGAPIYEDFSGRHVAGGLATSPGRTRWLAMGASAGFVTAILAQTIDGQLRILADWVREGEPRLIATDILSEANLEAGVQPHIVMGPLHFDQYNNVGLRQALTKKMVEVRKGTPPESGRPVIRDLLRKEIRSMPGLQVSEEARWTANGFAGGYCRQLLKGGMLADYAEEGVYRTLMESLESFAGLLKLGMADEDDAQENVRYDYTAAGRRFISARR